MVSTECSNACWGVRRGPSALGNIERPSVPCSRTKSRVKGRPRSLSDSPCGAGATMDSPGARFAGDAGVDDSDDDEVVAVVHPETTRKEQRVSWIGILVMSMSGSFVDSA
jgi:hypothetical protein